MEIISKTSMLFAFTEPSSSESFLVRVISVSAASFTPSVSESK
ncbi:hypothetical protein [Aureibaculum marinum]|nr:hypothetical protein [Aureibaculum marinum]